MNIGVLLNYHQDTDIEREFLKVRELDLQSCQLCVWNPELYTGENATKIKNAAEKTGVFISALWAGWTGPAVWDFYEGPTTLGIIPEKYRKMRLQQLYKASGFAELLGVADLITHVGFLPENPNDPVFAEIVKHIRQLALVMKNKGQYFLFETGQETPVTLLRAIEEIGTGNLGVNFDTANLILYGKANSADAVLVLGKYIRGVHCKDGNYPANGKQLGEEKPLGRGMANMPLIFERLAACGYKGAYTIEREITGEEQIGDIITARNLLREIHDGTSAGGQNIQD